MANLYKFPEEIRLMFLHLWGIGLRISEVCILKGIAYYLQGGGCMDPSISDKNANI